MKSKMLFLICVCLIAFVFIAPSANAQDPVKVASQAFVEKLNNDNVRVLEYHSKPGSKEAMHTHSTSVLYVVSGGKFKSTTPDGKSQVVEYKSGDVVWRESLTHSGENVGDTEIHAILIEVKEAKPAMKK